MADTLSQDKRVGKLATPLGKDKLCLVRFEGTEAMGELFEYRIEAVSTEPNIDFNKALGQYCSVHLDTADHIGRDFSGILTEARWVGAWSELDLQLYRLVLRPWPWLLSLRSRCVTYVNMKPKDIIKQTLGDGANGDIVDLVIREYPTLEYTVQYRETNLNFALRMMEKWGIYYYFSFDKGDGVSPSRHQLVLADSDNHVALPAPASVIFQAVGRTHVDRGDLQQFNHWTTLSQMVPGGKFWLNDYDYNQPNKDLLAKRNYDLRYKHGDMLVYDYPGGYDQMDDGENLAQVRLDSEVARRQRWFAGGYAPSLTPGYTIQRTSRDHDSQDGTYLILRCNHRYGDQSYVSAGGAGASGSTGASYSGSYELSSPSPYRMPLHTRRPVIVGTQPAKVVSQSDMEIDVDELGRVLVEFYWDRDIMSRYDPENPGRNPSRRVRVGQFWAGAVRGALFVPRVGDEVMVAYEDGDPDRPIIVGSVYNGKNTVPMKLPQKKTQSGILTRSSMGGKGYHMLVFDDTAGSERVKLRSQKDLMFKALNNEQRDIGSNQTETVGGDETITVGTETSGGNFTVNAVQTITLNVGPMMDSASPSGMDMPLTQIKMDQNSITLNVGPDGVFAQIKMDPSGVTISGTPASQLTVQPSGITTMTPTITFMYGPVTFGPAPVTIPLATIGAGTVGGALPII
jgi:type VI secretion system secreted protein VgrG